MKEDTNFALIVVGIVAIVGIVGLLNFNAFTGRATGTNVIQTPTEKELYLTQWECGSCNYDGTNCKYECDSFLVETTSSSASSYKFWVCGNRLCHKLYFRTS